MAGCDRPRATPASEPNVKGAVATPRGMSGNLNSAEAGCAIPRLSWRDVGVSPDAWLRPLPTITGPHARAGWIDGAASFEQNPLPRSPPRRRAAGPRRVRQPDQAAG